MVHLQLNCSYQTNNTEKHAMKRRNNKTSRNKIQKYFKRKGERKKIADKTKLNILLKHF